MKKNQQKKIEANLPQRWEQTKSTAHLHVPFVKVKLA